MLECPDGFDPEMWANLTEMQRQHIMGEIDSDPKMLLEHEQHTLLHSSVYSQCWLALKRSIFADGVLKAEVTLEQIDALEQYCLTGILHSMAAMAKKTVESSN